MPQAIPIIAAIASVASTAATVSQMIQSWSSNSSTYQDSGKSLTDAKKYLEQVNKTSDDPAEKGDLQKFREMMAEVGKPVSLPDQITSAADVRELRDGWATLLDEYSDELNLTADQKTEIGKIIDTLGEVAVVLEKEGDTTASTTSSTLGKTTNTTSNTGSSNASGSPTVTPGTTVTPTMVTYN
jgi:soluble cytochrome b562